MDLLQRDNTIGIDTPSSECAGPASDISDRYYELLYAVETKFPNEFRHEYGTFVSERMRDDVIANHVNSIKIQLNKEQTIDAFLLEFKTRLLLWLEEKPTGKATIQFSINQGGIRGFPKMEVTQNLPE